MRELAAGVAAPVVVTTLALAAIWRGQPGVTEGDLHAARRRTAMAVVLPLIFGAATVAGFGSPFPIDAGRDWMLPVTLAAALAGVVGAWFGARRWAGLVTWMLWAAILTGGLFLIAGNRLKGGWPLAQALPLIAGFAAAGVAAAWSIGRAGREAGGLTPMLLVLAVALSSGIAALSGHILQAVWFATLCAIVGPAWLVALWRPGLALGGSAAFGGAFLGASWFFMSVLAETPWWACALGAASVVAVGASGVGALGRMRGVRAWLVRGAIVALPGAVAVGVLALQTARAETYEY